MVQTITGYTDHTTEARGIAFHWIEGRMCHPDHVNNIEMAVEHEGPAAWLSNTGDDVRSTWRDLLDLDRAPPVAQNVRQHRCDREFAWRAGDE